MRNVRTVGDLMTRNVVAVSEEDNLLEVQKRLESRSFHHLPVIDGTRVVGMLSQRDMLATTVAGFDRGGFGLARESRYLEQSFVRDLMRTPVICVGPDDGVRLAARRMLQHRVGALPVVDAAQNLLGIITENDLVRSLAEQADDADGITPAEG